MMLMRLHFKLDHRALVSQKINRLVFVSRLDFDPRLCHHNIACVDTLGQLDYGTFLSCLNSLLYGSVFAEFRVDDYFLIVLDLWRPVAGSGVSGRPWPDPCYALHTLFENNTYRLSALGVSVWNFRSASPRDH